MPDIPLSHRMTYALGRWLSRWGIDARQYHWLLQTSLQMDFRIRRPQAADKESIATKSRLKFTIFMNIVLGSVFASGLVKFGAHTLVFTTATVGFGMLIITSRAIIEFPRIVIAPDDFLIMAHRPVSARTFFAVKLSNLVFYAGASSFALFVVPAFVGIRCADSSWFFPFCYFPVAISSCIFVIGLVVLFYAIAFRFEGRAKVVNVILFLQAGLTFMVFTIYHLLPWFTGGGLAAIKDANILNLWNSWARYFPSYWFGGLAELLLGHRSKEATILAAGAVFGVVTSIPVMFRSVSLGYSAHLQQMASLNRTKGGLFDNFVAGPFMRFVGRWFLRTGEELAFFQFISSMLRYNLLLKMQFYPTAGILAAIFVPPLITKRVVVDPFMQADFGRAAILSITSYLFGVGSLAVLLPYSNEYQAAWLFQIAPVTRPETALRALKKAIVIVLFLPVFSMNLLFFSMHWPMSHALKMSIFSFLIGLVVLQIVLLRFRGYPFSRKIENVTINRFLVIFFTVMAMPFLLVYLPSPFAGTGNRFLLVLGGLFILVVLLGWANDRLYSRSQRACDHEVISRSQPDLVTVTRH